MKVLIIGDLLLEVAELIQEEVVVIHLVALVALEHILLAVVTVLVVVLEHILLVAVVVEVLPVVEVQLEAVAGDKTIAYNNI